jgi:hypothetical protein
MTKLSEQTSQQIERFIKKISQKFPLQNDCAPVTDIHIRVVQESGEMLAFDDDENEITRCVVEEWIGNTDENFYENVKDTLTSAFKTFSTILDNMGILKPYSFVLENEDKESIAELYIADDDTVIIGSELMADLDSDLNTFLEHLLNEEA